MSDMPPALILCGGRGTRLREKTDLVPKPMVEIGGMPLLWHIMKIYACHGVREFILCVGYRSEVIVDFFANYQQKIYDLRIDLAAGTIDPLPGERPLEDWAVTIARTGVDSNTGQRLALARKYIQSDRFFLTYGDGVADVHIGKLLDQHIDSGKQVTLTGVRPSSRFGELSIEDSTITSFRQKPQVTEGWVNGGFMVIETAALDMLPQRAEEPSKLSVETDLIAPLAERGQAGIYRHSGFWQCMDTYREMQLLEDLWQSGAPPWKLW